MDRRDDLSPLGFLQLVGQPVRWQLLQELTRSDRRVGELTELVGEPQNLVSYHLAELRKAGLVSARRSSSDARDTYYRAEPRRCAELLSSANTALHPGVRLHRDAPEEIKIPGPRPKKVLFLCTGNSARSQIAEALLERLSGERVDASSAGSHPKELHRGAVRVMADRGIDISDRQPKHLSRFGRTRFDHVVTLCDKVREVCPEFPGQPVSAHWSIPDPAAAVASDDAGYEVFRRTAEDIEERVGMLIAQMAVDTKGRRAS